MSILERLYMGTLYPYSKFDANIKSFKACRDKALQSCAQFMEKLPDDLKEEFNALMDNHWDEFPYELEQNFADGFSIGVRMMSEVFSNITNLD